MDKSQIDAAKARTLQAFSEMAPEYDQGGPAFFSHFGRRLVDLAGVRSGARVLDVATGRGAVLLPASAMVGSDGFVTGIDLTQAMVQAITDDLARLAVTNAEVRLMDAEQLDFRDGAFDIVLCGFGLMFFPRLAVALAEFRRVLTDGGTFAASTFETLPPTPAIASVMNAYQHTSQRPLTQELSTVEELSESIGAAGFRNVTVHQETFEAVHADEDAYWAWAMSLLPGVWYRRQPADIQARFRSDVYAQLGSVKRPDGIHESITALFAIASK